MAPSMERSTKDDSTAMKRASSAQSTLIAFSRKPASYFSIVAEMGVSVSRMAACFSTICELT